jgi:hypothetical protein
MGDAPANPVLASISSSNSGKSTCGKRSENGLPQGYEAGRFFEPVEAGSAVLVNFPFLRYPDEPGNVQAYRLGNRQRPESYRAGRL